MEKGKREGTVELLRQELDGIYRLSTCLIAVIDENLHVRTSNLDSESGTADRASLGDLLRCIHRSAADEGSPTTGAPDCEACELRSLIQETLTEGREYRGREICLPIQVDTHTEEKRFIVSTSRLERPDGACVLLTADDVSEREVAKARLESINNIFASLGTDPDENIHTIVARTCEALEGACSLYNRLDDAEKSLCAWSGHNLPDDFPKEDAPVGHICYEATIKGKNRPIVLGDLEGSDYERTDPYVQRYGLKAYLGYPVRVGDRPLGSLCIVDTRKRQFSDTDIHIITTLAKGVQLEEERKRSRRRVEDLLEEKELVLREVHHRIKNDMAIIQSLLSLQSGSLESSEAVAALEEAQSRIGIMREIYETLYQGSTYGTVAVLEYLDRLLENIVRSHGNGRVKLERNIEAGEIAVRLAFPLGIIINELVTNGFKYAFPETESGRISVSVVHGERSVIEITVSDDGIGMEAGEQESAFGFGLRLVKTLAERHGGSFFVTTGEGTTVRVRLAENA
jgi:two-component sensor histidine kinase